ncbi:PREDICTED: VQ motif-containing protein 4-like [Nicotiana attenuata]|uniref:Vq motif-containing protein 4 n=1 Tax=Nicotiana attenuata TaxID=49451 RepID=A0A1J6KH56_NICAT|nr:PREDICTED: VQ motif-containing protein 4-like [Nicotiana attenuata]OIT28004.1 vq motif-containing protein 4 [Nicotiana attenuata]
METLAKPQEYRNPYLISSPDSHSSNSSSCSNSGTSNGLHHRYPTPPTTPTPATPPALPPQLPITRSEPNNPYPTTFVQADASSFKQVVQMLTGSSETAKVAATPGRAEPVRHPIPPIKTGPKKEKSSSKLYERRNSMKNFKISPLGPGVVNKSVFSAGFSGSPRTATPEILSPSILDFPSLVLSPVTPLIHDPFNRSPHSGGVSMSSENLDLEAEEKAIAKKGFFLHPSPATTPRESEPRLLPLFPVTSPRVSGSSNSDS